MNLKKEKDCLNCKYSKAKKRSVFLFCDLNVVSSEGWVRGLRVIENVPDHVCDKWVKK